MCVINTSLDDAKNAKDIPAAAANDIKSKPTCRGLDLNIIPTFTFYTSTRKKPQLDPHSDVPVFKGDQAGCGGVVEFGILKSAWFGCARGGMLGGGEG